MTAQRRGAASDSSSLHAPVRSEARVYHTRGRLCSTVGCRDRQGGHASGSEPFTAARSCRGKQETVSLRPDRVPKVVTCSR